jgi:hypothetical protein
MELIVLPLAWRPCDIVGRWLADGGLLRVLFPARRLVDPDLLIPDLIRRDP